MGAVTLFHSGEREGLKLTVHAALGALAALCCGYNVIALSKRREGHLALNTLLYGTLVVLEARKVQHHAGSR